MVKTQRLVVLISLDGWGLRKSAHRNAIRVAATPNMDRFWHDFPHAALKASGKAVGLPEGFIGNSEVGHITMGAGRLVPHYLLHINQSIRNGSFFRNKELLHAMRHARKNKSALHIMGLVGDAGVHAHQDHLIALVRMAARHGVKHVFIHAILDGRDSPPGRAGRYLAKIQKALDEIGAGRIASVCGRYYAMDRDTRWDRTERAYRLVAQGIGLCTRTWRSAIRNAKAQGKTDEFVPPTIILPKGTHTVPHVRKGDALIFFNYRSDRARQITHAFVDKRFKPFKRQRIANLRFVCFTEYDQTIKVPVTFCPPKAADILGEVLSKKGIRQMRIAETEKYAHVTFFFNNGREKPFPKEDRILIPSPRVATYDTVPQMSAKRIAAAAVRTIKEGKHQFILINFANGDMVGHTGVWRAAINACETVDACVGRIVGATLAQGGYCLITADHGNCEDMTPAHITSHTKSQVPFILASNDPRQHQLHAKGTLQHVAPTVLDLLEIRRPKEMERSMLR